MEKKQEKPLLKFQGTFNWNGELIVMDTTAYTPAKAKQNLFFRLANKLGRSVGLVNSHYKSSPNGFRLDVV